MKHLLKIPQKKSKCNVSYLDKPVKFFLTEVKIKNFIGNNIIECYIPNINNASSISIIEEIDNNSFETLKENLDWIEDKNLDNILSKRKTKISYDQTQLWCKNTFGIINDKLILLSFIYLKLELIELRWCPFKRSKKLYYRNKDKRYLEPSEEIIYKIGKILVEHETITCNNCPKIINSNWQYSKSNTLSIFQPLLDFMITEINYN